MFHQLLFVFFLFGVIQYIHCAREDNVFNITTFGDNNESTYGIITSFDDDPSNGLIGVIGKQHVQNVYLSGKNMLSAVFPTDTTDALVTLNPSNILSPRQKTNINVSNMAPIFHTISASFEDTEDEYTFTVSGSIFDVATCLSVPDEFVESLKGEQEFCTKYRSAIGEYSLMFNNNVFPYIYHNFFLVAQSDGYFYKNISSINIIVPVDELAQALDVGDMWAVREIHHYYSNMSVVPFSETLVVDKKYLTPDLYLTLYSQTCTTRKCFWMKQKIMFDMSDNNLVSHYTIDNTRWIQNIYFTSEHSPIGDYIYVNDVVGGELLVETDTSTKTYLNDIYTDRKRGTGVDDILSNGVKWGVASNDTLTSDSRSFFSELSAYAELYMGHLEFNQCIHFLDGSFGIIENGVSIAPSKVSSTGIYNCILFFEAQDSVALVFDFFVVATATCDLPEPPPFPIIQYMDVTNEVLFLSFSDVLQWNFLTDGMTFTEETPTRPADMSSGDVECRVQLLNIDTLMWPNNTECEQSVKYIDSLILGDGLNYECDLCNPNYTYIDYRVQNSEDNCNNLTCYEFLNVALFVYALDKTLVCQKANDTDVFDRITVQIGLGVYDTLIVFNIILFTPTDVDCSDVLGYHAIISSTQKNEGDFPPRSKRAISEDDITFFYEHVITLNDTIFIGFEMDQALSLLNTTSDEWENLLSEMFPTISNETMFNLLFQLTLLDEEPTIPPTTPPPPTTVPPTTIAPTTPPSTPPPTTVSPTPSSHPTSPPVVGSSTFIIRDMPSSLNYLKGNSIIAGISMVTVLFIIVMSSMSVTTVTNGKEAVPLLTL